ncbi:MAG TPA: anti-sigma factor [Streptosporangiaceae bacterium]
MKRQDIHALAGPYALGALPDDERRLFEDHLEACESCRQEVRGLTETAARLGSAVAETPPAALRDRVMAEIERTAQVPPVAEGAPVRRIRWSTAAASWAAAACLAIAVAVGAVAVHDQRQAAQLRAERARITAVLSAPDAHITTTAATSYGRGTAVVSRSRDRLVFTLAGSRRLPVDRAYQLWYLTPQGAARSAGLLDTHPDTTPTTTTLLAGARTLALTVEPAGGSRQPTSQPIMSLPIR